MAIVEIENYSITYDGVRSAVDNVSFAPGAAIIWTPTITAMGDDGFKLIMKEA